MPKISVCIPTYNNAEMLRGCLDSVLKQTYKDFDIVVCNDGSTDNTQEILDSYDIKSIKTRHLGISNARQTALDNSNGEYIAIMDTDCLMTEDRLEESIRAIKGYDIVYSDYYGILNGVVKEFPSKDMKVKNYKDILDLQIVPNYTVMARRKCFDGAYRKEFKVNDDSWTIMYWVKKGYKFKHIKKFLMHAIYTGKNVGVTRVDECSKVLKQLKQEVR